ncbi:NYN domain-containing protein [Candidatus Parcubacteria bacterium]|nr:NYN domain-containing protein [Candidatus Parcubacteria bacterium]
MEKSLKNYAFVDSQNLNLGIKGCDWNLDFAKFFVYLKDKYKIGKAFLFIGYVAGNEALYTFLQKAGYIVIFKPTLEYEKDGEIHTKGNVDTELVLHTMIEYPNYNKAVIVSGDGDFHYLIEYLEKNKKLGRIIIPNRKSYSQLLWKFRKYMDYMNNLNNKLGRH